MKGSYLLSSDCTSNKLEAIELDWEAQSLYMHWNTGRKLEKKQTEGSPVIIITKIRKLDQSGSDFGEDEH